ncbi:MAG: hypothetical protein KAT03_03395, partial [Candidatus Heimdallarchaeota archaeon]|nr:hypothetical protein [Candidatus Heimdallarchaeota archaeon]
GIVFTIIATFSLFSGIGLLFKLNAARLFAMITSALLLIFLFPLVIVFYLSQNDVKELFIKTGSQ